MKQTILLPLVVVLFIYTARAGDKNKSDCYPITSADLVKSAAPKFSQYPSKPENIIHPARVNLKSNPIARTFRTVLRQGASEGPNFAGHYTVVGWGCGSSCCAIAVVDAKTGNVITPDSFSITSGVELDADDFEPNAGAGYWGLRYRLDSRLLIVLGSLDGDDNRAGAFYFIMEKGRLKPIFEVKVKKHYCDEPGD